METSTGTYLEFIAKRYLFLIPLQWIRDIQGFGGMEADFPILDWNGLLGKNSIEEQEKYTIIVTYEGETFGMVVTRVIGLCEIGQGAVLELKEPIRNQNNLFLKAAVVHEEMIKRTAFEDESDTQTSNLAFILDPAILTKYLPQKAG